MKKGAPLATMGAKLRAPLNPLLSQCCDVRAVSGRPSIGPSWYRETLVSFSRYNMHTEKSFRNPLSTKIRLYLPFSDRFGTKRIVSVWFQINSYMVNTIWFGFDLLRFGKDSSVCRDSRPGWSPHLIPSKCSDSFEWIRLGRAQEYQSNPRRNLVLDLVRSLTKCLDFNYTFPKDFSESR